MSHTPCKFWGWDQPPNWVMGGARGTNMVPLECVLLVYFYLPHSDQSAISNRFSASPKRYRPTDGQTDRQTGSFTISKVK